MFKTEVSKSIYWVGKIDDRKVPFHRLTLEKGTTYNSYLIESEKPTIIDTVDIMFGGEYVKNLEKIIDLNNIHFIVINHVEPDHAGGLPALINKAKNATIVTTKKGMEMLVGMFKLTNKEFLIVSSGDTLDIGGKTLRFFETPYLHTEETMITYCEEDKVLFPCDLFSTHIAAYELFNDKAAVDITEDFQVYYKLIMGPHRSYVRNMLAIIKELDIKIIAPSHGYILRDDAKKYINIYDSQSYIDMNSINKKALILYSSMTGNTAKIAQNVSAGLSELNIQNNIINIKNASIETIRSLALESDAIFIGSSTKYGDMIGNLENIMSKVIKLDLSNKLGVAFGSYGWSGEAVEIINDYINKSNMINVNTSYLIKSTGDENLKLPLRVNFNPKDNAADLCIHAGKVIGELLIRQV